jgi:hypothetical protein
MLRRIVQMLALVALMLGLVVGPQVAGRMASADQFDTPRVLCAIDGGGSSGY